MLYKVRAKGHWYDDVTHILYTGKKKQIIWFCSEKKIECIYVITYKKEKLKQQIET